MVAPTLPVCRVPGLGLGSQRSVPPLAQGRLWPCSSVLLGSPSRLPALLPGPNSRLADAAGVQNIPELCAGCSGSKCVLTVP